MKFLKQIEQRNGKVSRKETKRIRCRLKYIKDKSVQNRYEKDIRLRTLKYILYVSIQIKNLLLSVFKQLDNDIYFILFEINFNFQITKIS